mgnify:CR=1 FL=1
MRTIKQIKKEEKKTWDKVWHYKFGSSYTKKDYLKARDTDCAPDIFFKPESKKSIKDELKKKKRIENEYGLKNLGPYSDYESGKLAGRYETLLWVLGEEWGQLQGWY